MLAGIKELKNWVTGMWQPGITLGEEDYRKMEYSAHRHLHTPPTPRPITYEQESRIKSIKFH